jgi:signal recognition particle receptor subunit beta
MVAINYAFREISCKIVYYGPGLSGKTTNLQYVHHKVPGKTKGELISLATDADRTLYFDFLPINLGAIQGFATKFQLYTVPGQVYYNATRKLVLRGVDGLVFVADSQRAKMDENLESLKNLYDNLEEYGYDPQELPLVIQYNKRDLPDVMTVGELQAALNPHGLPYFEAVAVDGTGVFDTLKLIIKLVLDKARKGSELAGSTGDAATPKPQPASTVPQAAAQAAPHVAAQATQPPAHPSVPVAEPPQAAPVPARAPLQEPAPVSAAAEEASEPVPAQSPPSIAAVEPVAPLAVSAGVAATDAAVAPAPEPETAGSDALPAPAAGQTPETISAPAPAAAATAQIVNPSQAAPQVAQTPSVIPPAPSLKRTADARKKTKRSFWRKLFKWI